MRPPLEGIFQLFCGWWKREGKREKMVKSNNEIHPSIQHGNCAGELCMAQEWARTKPSQEGNLSSWCFLFLFPSNSRRAFLRAEQQVNGPRREGPERFSISHAIRIWKPKRFLRLKELEWKRKRLWLRVDIRWNSCGDYGSDSDWTPDVICSERPTANFPTKNLHQKRIFFAQHSNFSLPSHFHSWKTIFLSPLRPS